MAAPEIGAGDGSTAQPDKAPSPRANKTLGKSLASCLASPFELSSRLISETAYSLCIEETISTICWYAIFHVTLDTWTDKSEADESPSNKKKARQAGPSESFR